MQYHVYILYSQSLDKYYVGHTKDLNDRLTRHNNGRSKYTKSGAPWKLVYTEEFPGKAQAYQREQEIKRKKSRKYIEELAAG